MAASLTLRPEARERLESLVKQSRGEQARISSEIGITQGGLSHIRNGRRGLQDLTIAARLARVLNYQKIGEAFDGPHQQVSVEAILHNESCLST